MTRIIHENLPITFETNGDCSTFTLNFPDEATKLVAELCQKLRGQRFLIQEKFTNDNMIKFVLTQGGKE